MASRARTQNTQQAHSSWVSIKLMLIHRLVDLPPGKSSFHHEIECVSSRNVARGSIYLRIAAAGEIPEAHQRFILFINGSCHRCQSIYLYCIYRSTMKSNKKIQQTSWPASRMKPEGRLAGHELPANTTQEEKNQQTNKYLGLVALQHLINEVGTNQEQSSCP